MFSVFTRHRMLDCYRYGGRTTIPPITSATAVLVDCEVSAGGDYCRLEVHTSLDSASVNLTMR